MKTVFTLHVMFCILGITACSKQEAKGYDVEYFKQNAEMRTKTLQECRNNPGELEDTPNCINAEQAQVIIDASRKGRAQF